MKLSNYIKEVRAEMSHVSWPSRTQNILFTILVVLISVGVAFYLGLFDFLFKLGLEKLINN